MNIQVACTTLSENLSGATLLWKVLKHMTDNRDMCLVSFAFSSQIFWEAAETLCRGALAYRCPCACVFMCACVYVSEWTTRVSECVHNGVASFIDEPTFRFVLQLFLSNLNASTLLDSVLQNDILAHTVEIKVDAPAHGNTADAENTAPGNYVVEWDFLCCTETVRP